MTNNDSTNIKYRFISGGISGIVEVVCTHPIDVIKTKMQEASQKKVPNVLMNNPTKYFYNKYRLHGIKYMYAGFIPRIIGIVPMRFVFWGVQGNSNEYFKNYKINDTNRLILSGIIGGSAQTLIDSPIETMKIRQIINGTKTYIPHKSIFFIGFIPTLYRNTLFAAILNYTVNISPSDNYATYFLKGAFGGLIASIITQPLDYIKTERQKFTINQRSIKDIIINDNKLLMVGTTPRAILGFFNMGIGITIYTLMTKIFDK
jgi:hypothetical protein